jgi:hypothetical protein
MCCDAIYNDEPIVGECPECGAPVDADGDAVGEHCGYSPRCPVCGDSPCDESC